MHSKYLISGLVCKADTLPSSTKGQQQHRAKLPPGATQQLTRNPRAAPDRHTAQQVGDPFICPTTRGPTVAVASPHHTPRRPAGAPPVLLPVPTRKPVTSAQRPLLAPGTPSPSQPPDPGPDSTSHTRMGAAREPGDCQCWRGCGDSRPPVPLGERGSRCGEHGVLREQGQSLTAGGTLRKQGQSPTQLCLS